MSISIIILAAGSGSRTNLNYNKVFHKIHRKKVLDYSLEFFEKYEGTSEIILVCSQSDFNMVQEIYGARKITIIVGGNTRQESVYKALNEANKEYVLVHDAARPYLNLDKIRLLVEEMVRSKACTLAVPVKDTIVISSGNRLTKTLVRDELVALQTPQGFDRQLLLKAHKKAYRKKYIATDDTDLIRKFTNVEPTYVEGDYRSIKLTTDEDIAVLEVVL